MIVCILIGHYKSIYFTCVYEKSQYLPGFQKEFTAFEHQLEYYAILRRAIHKIPFYSCNGKVYLTFGVIYFNSDQMDQKLCAKNWGRIFLKKDKKQGGMISFHKSQKNDDRNSL